MDEQDNKVITITEEEKTFTEEEVMQAIEQLSNSGAMNYGYEDTFMMEDIEDRKLYINYQIDKNVNELITYHILRYNTIDKDIPVKDRIPIKIYINTEGGSISDGLSLLSAMKLSKTPIYTITFGYCYSMGFLLFLGGSRRFASPDATFMNHSGRMAVEDNVDRVIDSVDFLKAQERKNDSFIMSRTKLTKKELTKSKRKDNFYFADQAHKLGIATEIIGVTCDIDEVL